MSYLEKLNDDQRRAAVYGVAPGDTSHCRPLLIIAGAGSGKTTTLAGRVAHLIVNGADPGRILLLTFSRRAATQLAQRVARIVAEAKGGGQMYASAKISWSGTFHGVGARLLRQFAKRIGLSAEFTIHDREDSADLMNIVRHDLGLSEKSMRFPLKGTCLAIYSHAVNAGLGLAETLKRHFPWCMNAEAELGRLFEAYVAAKQAQGVLDYDDLLLYWAEMMGAQEVAVDVRQMFDHVLVDEYQDTNPIQARILQGLKPDGIGLTVVGDDAQSIYGFRAATVRNILDLPTAFDPPAEVVTLERNYRSTQPILEASNAVMALARERYSKILYSTRESEQKARLVTVADDIAQVGAIVERVLANREAGMPLKAQAVLFRTSHHSGLLEIELARRNIPFVKFGGLRFLEAAHVKDLLCVLRWAENPRDRVAAFRALQLLPGIGPGTAAKAFDRVATTGAPFAPLTIFGPPSATLKDWPAFVALLQQLNDNSGGWPADIEAARTWFQPYLEANYPDAAVRGGDLDQIVQIAGQYGSRQRFLTELTLDPPNATSDEAGPPLLDEDYLILSTIHSAKGQEWTAVYVLNVVDGCIPSDMSTGRSEDIEEERRLLYVAMTRAKDELHLMLPQKFYVHQQARGGDRHLFASRTRFIPPALVAHFEHVSWPGRRLGGNIRIAPAGASVDLKARVGGAWKARA